jgi:hypothetical protein
LPLIIRIDVDRPYGRSPWWRHVASRLSSDWNLPRLPALGYLGELEAMLLMLNRAAAPACVFFRQCTVPTPAVLDLMSQGNHALGLHLEDSRSLDTFLAERAFLEQATGRRVRAVSKHGSGKEKYGRRHHAPYEPEKYEQWCAQAGLPLFLGNLEDASLPSYVSPRGVTVFPSAFWLEPAWRDTRAFSIEWLVESSRHRDVVLLMHPENTLSSERLTEDLSTLLRECDINPRP